MIPSQQDSPLRHLRGPDARGVLQLAARATVGVTRVVEEVHHSVLDTVGMALGTSITPVREITELVYRTIYGTTELVGESATRLLATLEPLLGSAGETAVESPERAALLAALNGLMGDRLVADNSPFAIPMTFRFRDRSLRWHDSPLAAEAGEKVLLLIHGLCMNERQWRRDLNGVRFDHGQLLAEALGYSPVYLRYNSGLHVSENGRELAERLEQLLADWPVPVKEVTVLAHSMGGLLIRSALHQAGQTGLRWPELLRSVVFLGTPHHGAPLERAGNGLEAVLGAVPYVAPLARPGRLRSAGITDLRYGLLLEEDWQGRDRFQPVPDERVVVPLSENVAWYAVAATLATERSCLADRLLGDGLVPVHSALGIHDEPRRNLALPASATLIAFETSHLGLLSSTPVAQRLRRWLAAPEPGH